MRLGFGGGGRILRGGASVGRGGVRGGVGVGPFSVSGGSRGRRGGGDGGELLAWIFYAAIVVAIVIVTAYLVALVYVVGMLAGLVVMVRALDRESINGNRASFSKAERILIRNHLFVVRGQVWNVVAVAGLLVTVYKELTGSAEVAHVAVAAGSTIVVLLISRFVEKRMTVKRMTFVAVVPDRSPSFTTGARELTTLVVSRFPGFVRSRFPDEWTSIGKLPD